MPIDERLDAITTEQWEELADVWLEEVSVNPDQYEASDRVTYMKFLGRPNLLWDFTRLAFERASNDYQLVYIGADLVERLLGAYGEGFVDLVSDVAREQSDFARLLTAVRRHTMSQGVWRAVQELRLLAKETLRDRGQHERVLLCEKRYQAMLRRALEERQAE